MDSKALMLIALILLGSVGTVAAGKVWDLQTADCGTEYNAGDTVTCTWDVFKSGGGAPPASDPTYINVEYYWPTGSSHIVSLAFSETTESDSSHVVQSSEAGGTTTAYIYYTDNSSADHTQGYKTYPGGTAGTYISDTYNVPGVVAEFAFLGIILGMLSIIYFSMRRKFFGN